MRRAPTGPVTTGAEGRACPAWSRPGREKRSRALDRLLPSRARSGASAHDRGSHAARRRQRVDVDLNGNFDSVLFTTVRSAGAAGPIRRAANRMTAEASLPPRPAHDGHTILSGNGTRVRHSARPVDAAVTGTVFRT